MAAINIRRDEKDPFYRYKMPRLISKVEGRGNGIKTIIPNMSDIARSLSRPPAYPTKYFGCELGALVQCDDAADRYQVNGAHNAEKLQTLLDGFIKKFVLCPHCKNPETDLVISKDETVYRVCKACGKRNTVDMTHRLTTYIVKNPPATAKSSKDKKDKKSKKNGSSDSVKPPTPPPDAENGEENDELSQIASEAANLRLANDEDDEEWAADLSAEAVRARMAQLAVPTSLIADEDDEDAEDPIEAFGTFLDNNPKATDAEVVQEATSLGIRDYKAVVVLVQVLFTEQILAEKQIPKRAKLLKQFIKTEKDQKSLLGGFERLVGLSFPKELLDKAPIILKELYDADLVEEEVLIAWGQKASKKYVDRKVSTKIIERAAPFLKWLEEAEEEESDEEEDDE
ncbi:domain found in IF2B/IF5-domain-containing protein [Cladochytrium replicatum]|nr:domain found in IF2B/IF5-domain-containing protein [Cladochytrium replicatum]